MSAAVTFDASGADRKLRAVQAALTPERLHAVAGRAVLNLVKAHLVDRDHTANRLGGKRTHFYHKAAQSAHEAHDAAHATVTISATGFALQRFGGTVVPVNARALTISIAPEAHGRRASDFPGAFLCKIKGKAYIAIKRGKREALQLLFALVRSATIQADASVLPDDEDIHQTAATSVDAFISRQSARANGAGGDPGMEPATP